MAFSPHRSPIPKAAPRKKLRRPVPGEDLPTIKNVMKEIQGQEITLDEFLSLVTPHTGDKGAALIKVMTEDINAFRKMVIKVYTTMNQDVSDVLANEQMELAKTYAERQRLLLDKMVRALQDIHNICPEFDINEYYKDSDIYLGRIFKLVDVPDDEEVEAARRQLAYHRLQWLHSEGERLQAENVQLQSRLKELKKIQRAEIQESIQIEREADAQKRLLERQQAGLQSKVEELSEVLHETIVAEETLTTNKKKLEQRKSLGRQTAEEIPKRKGDKDWSIKTAAEIESVHVLEPTVSQSSSIKDSSQFGSKLKKPRPSIASSTLRPRGGIRSQAPWQASAVVQKPSTGAIPKKPVAGGKKKKKPKMKDRPAWQDVELEDSYDVFADTGPPRARSPQGQQSGCPPTCSKASPPRARSPAQQQQQTGRRGTAPRDQWTGFY